jgi:hypothetical protein
VTLAEGNLFDVSLVFVPKNIAVENMVRCVNTEMQPDTKKMEGKVFFLQLSLSQNYVQSLSLLGCCVYVFFVRGKVCCLFRHV